MAAQEQSGSGTGTLVLVGWGMKPGRVAAHVTALGPARLLILADPLQGAEIRAALPAEAPAPEQIRCVFGAKSGEATLIVHSVPGLYSLKPAKKALREIFPGLQTRQRRTVPQRPVKALVERLAEAPGPLRLAIETPGAEKPLLAALARAGLLDRVTALHLRPGREAFFAGAEPAAGLQGWLEAQHFRLEHVDDTEPDWPEMRFVADAPGLRRALAAAGKAAQAQLAELETARGDAAAQAAQRAALDALLETERQTVQAARADIAQQQTRIAELEAALEAERRQAEEARSGATEARAALEARSAELETALEAERGQAREAQAAAAGQAAQQQTRIAELEAALEAERARTQQQQAAAQETAAHQQERLRDLDAEMRRRDEVIATQEQNQRSLRAQIEEQAGLLQEQHEEMQRRDGIIAGLKEKTAAETGAVARLTDQLAQQDGLVEYNRELESQLMRAREELRRAEGQVGLIKDLLLREPEL